MLLRYLYRAKSSFVRCRCSKVNSARLEILLFLSLSFSLCAKFSVNPEETTTTTTFRYRRRQQFPSYLIDTINGRGTRAFPPLSKFSPRAPCPRAPVTKHTLGPGRAVTKVVSYFLQKCCRKTRMYYVRPRRGRKKGTELNTRSNVGGAARIS